MIFWLLLKLEISYRVMLSPRILVSFLRVCQARDYCIGSKFWKFYLIKAGFILGELVSSLVKVFRLFRLEQTDFLVFRVWTQEVDVQTSYLWQGPACL
jgi:hypothetical protein